MHQYLVELPTISAFLLIQNGHILDLSSDPCKLKFFLLDEFRDWQIYVGINNEFGNKEVVGCITKVWVASQFSKIILHSKSRGCESKVSFTATEMPSLSIRARLFQLWRDGELRDPVNLPTINLFAA